jgi:hypothetical protein
MQKVGVPSKTHPNRPGAFLQTERAAHEQWAMLVLQHPKAAALMHLLCSKMDVSTNAVVASQSVLAQMLGCCVRSLKTYIKTLEDNRWIQVVSLGKGSTNAYVVNSMVAWAKDRDTLKYATFTAQVIASVEDQSPIALTADLRRIPVLFNGDMQLPSGESAEPPSQMLLDGVDHDLPAIKD